MVQGTDVRRDDSPLDASWQSRLFRIGIHATRSEISTIPNGKRNIFSVWDGTIEMLMGRIKSIAAVEAGYNEHIETTSQTVEDVFTSSDLATLLDTSLDEVDYWVRTNLLVPSVRQSSGQGSRRLFSSDDVKQALLIRRLRKANWKPRQIARAIASLRSILKQPNMLEQPLLIHEGNAFLILCRRRENNLVLLDAASPGQYVMVIALETLEEETRRRMGQNK